MARLYYRGMAEENGKPKIGRNPRLLGVRPSIDIDVEQVPKEWLDEQGYLRPETERQSSEESVTVAIRNTKGMSVSLSMESLPPFRKPPTFGGTGKILFGRLTIARSSEILKLYKIVQLMSVFCQALQCF